MAIRIRIRGSVKRDGETITIVNEGTDLLKMGLGRFEDGEVVEVVINGLALDYKDFGTRVMLDGGKR